MNRRVFLLIFTVILMLVSTKVYALSLEKTEISIANGEKKNIKLYADLPDDTVKVEFTLVFDSYDIPVYFSPTSGITDETPNSIKHTLILEEEMSGETFLGSVIARVVTSPNVKQAGADLYSVNAYDSLGNKKALNNQNLQVKVITNQEEPTTANTNDNDNNDDDSTVDKDTTKKTYNLLEEIRSGETTILIVDDVFDYNLKVSSSVSELDLEVIPKKEKYKVEISNQVISELTDNKVTITVTNGKEKQDYVINVEVVKDRPVVEIDDTEFKINDSHKGFWTVMVIISGVGLFFGMLLNKVKK